MPTGPYSVSITIAGSPRMVMGRATPLWRRQLAMTSLGLLFLRLLMRRQRGEGVASGEGRGAKAASEANAYC